MPEGVEPLELDEEHHGLRLGSDEELLAAGFRAVEVLVAVLGAWGFTGDEALHRVRVVRSALHGFVSLEAEGGFGLALSVDESFELMVQMLLAGLEQG